MPFTSTIRKILVFALALVVLSPLAQVRAAGAELKVMVQLPEPGAPALTIVYSGEIKEDGSVSGTFIMDRSYPIVGTFTGFLDEGGVLTLDFHDFWFLRNPYARFYLDFPRVVVDLDTGMAEAITSDGMVWRSGHAHVLIRD